MAVFRLPGAGPCSLRAVCYLRHACRRAGARRLFSSGFGTIHAVSAEHGMVVAQDSLQPEIGADVLRQGGTRWMRQSRPVLRSLLLIRAPAISAARLHGDPLPNERGVTIDYRETGPGATTSDILLTDGSPISPNGAIALAIGVPAWFPGCHRARQIRLGPVSLGT